MNEVNTEPGNEYSFKKEVSDMSLLLADCMSDAGKADGNNFSATTQLGKSLREANQILKRMRTELRDRRKTIKASRKQRVPDRRKNNVIHRNHLNQHISYEHRIKRPESRIQRESCKP
jgi:hypothetical protein